MPEAAPRDVHSHEVDEQQERYHILGDVLSGERIFVPVKSFVTPGALGSYKEGMGPLEEAGPLSHVRVPPQSTYHAPPPITVSCKADVVLTAHSQKHHAKFPPALSLKFPALPRKSPEEIAAAEAAKSGETGEDVVDAAEPEAEEKPKPKGKKGGKKKKKGAEAEGDDGAAAEQKDGDASPDEGQASPAESPDGEKAAKPGGKKPGGKRGKKKAKPPQGEEKPPPDPGPPSVSEDTLRLAFLNPKCRCGLPADILYDAGPPHWLCANCGNRGLQGVTTLTHIDAMWGCVNADTCRWGLCESCHGVPLMRNGHPVWRSKRRVVYATPDGYWRVAPLGEEVDGRVTVGNEPEVLTTYLIRLDLHPDTLFPDALASVYPMYEIHPRMKAVKLYGVPGVNRRVEVTEGDDVDELIAEHFTAYISFAMKFSYRNPRNACYCGGVWGYNNPHISLHYPPQHCSMCTSAIKRPGFAYCEECHHFTCRACLDLPDFKEILEVEIGGDDGLGGVFLLQDSTVVASVSPLSSAFDAGVKKGMVVTEVNDRPVAHDSDIMQIYEEEKAKPYIELNVVFRDTESVIMTSVEKIAVENGNLLPHITPAGGWRLHGQDPHELCSIAEFEHIPQENGALVDITDLAAEGSPAAKDNTAIAMPNDLFDIDALFMMLDEPDPEPPASPPPRPKGKKGKKAAPQDEAGGVPPAEPAAAEKPPTPAGAADAKPDTSPSGEKDKAEEPGAADASSADKPKEKEEEKEAKPKPKQKAKPKAGEKPPPPASPDSDGGSSMGAMLPPAGGGGEGGGKPPPKKAKPAGGKGGDAPAAEGGAEKAPKKKPAGGAEGEGQADPEGEKGEKKKKPAPPKEGGAEGESAEVKKKPKPPPPEGKPEGEAGGGEAKPKKKPAPPKEPPPEA